MIDLTNVKVLRKTIEKDSAQLVHWYSSQKRDLPWRKDRDPYRIWISEIMLQQTTVAAVIPYYTRFLKRFPSLKSLAQASIQDVLAQWSGLGYYSRARNLHKAAQWIHGHSWPETAAELLELPGFGSYTSRAVASLAFGEKVGVLDGNVIRVLSRRFGLHWEWWRSKEKNRLQELADSFALQSAESAVSNQGLMELGATVCTPQNPSCPLCPWRKTCVALHSGEIENLPLKKPRRQKELWSWKPQVRLHAKKIALVKNDYAPFLKGQWILPGEALRLKARPARFAYRHTITHHEIFVLEPEKKTVARDGKKSPEIFWVPVQQLSEWIPSSMILRAVEIHLEKSKR